MGLKPDHWIAKMAREHAMIEPFMDHQVRSGKVSYGLTSAGYDLRISDEVMIFVYNYGDKIDPKNFSRDHLWKVSVVDGRITIPPYTYFLGRSVEHFNIPPDVVGTCQGKSTLARCGLMIAMCPLEPGWSGYLTLEAFNATQCPLIIYPGEGFAQVRFETLDEPCRVSYADRAGKYQDQPAEIVTARV